MRGPPTIAQSDDWVSPRADRHEFVTTVSVCDATAGTEEIRIDRRVMLIVFVAIETGGVCLTVLWPKTGLVSSDNVCWIGTNGCVVDTFG